MHMCMCTWSPNNGDKNEQNKQLLVPFLLQQVFYLLAILFVGITFIVFVLTGFFKEVNATNDTPTLVYSPFLL